jgi:hypothetical protein
MRWWLLGLAVSAGAGCTMTSLERHTVAQTDAVMDVRYREAMDNLALVAANWSALPSYATIYSGSATVQDQGQIMLNSTVPYYSVGSDVVNPSFQRQITQLWTLDPLLDPERMEAIRAACQWAIGGPDWVYKDSLSLLIRREQAPAGPDRHFGVAEDLARLPAGWLKVGRHREIPSCAVYKAHRGNTWVWVTPEGMKGLADFTLILQHIARVPINGQTVLNLPPSFTPIVIRTTDTQANDGFLTTVQALVNQNGQLVTDFPYFKLRVDDNRADSQLISILGSGPISSFVPH